MWSPDLEGAGGEASRRLGDRWCLSVACAKERPCRGRSHSLAGGRAGEALRARGSSRGPLHPLEPSLNKRVLFTASQAWSEGAGLPK